MADATVADGSDGSADVDEAGLDEPPPEAGHDGSPPAPCKGLASGYYCAHDGLNQPYPARPTIWSSASMAASAP